MKKLFLILAIFFASAFAMPAMACDKVGYVHQVEHEDYGLGKVTT